MGPQEREREMCECDLKRDKETENYVIDSILCGRGKHTEREKINTCDIEREREREFYSFEGNIEIE